MNALFTYLIESTGCITLLYIVYLLFLSRDTFFRVNRFYLLGMVFFSLTVPLVPFQWTLTGSPVPLVVMLEPVLITPEKVGRTLTDDLQWVEIVGISYITGSLIFQLRFGFQLFMLFRITRRFGIREQEGCKLVLVDRGYSPFSFLNLIYINASEVSSGCLTTILEHEQVHIRQRHSLDLLMFELATIVLWFNPVIWLTGREMKSIHEYLADEGVLQNGISRPLYQQMILNETMGVQVNNLTNNFNVSLIKKRMIMMTRSKSKKWAKSKVLIALPVMLALLFILTARLYSNTELTNTGKQAITPAQLLSVAIPDLQDKQKQEKQVKYTAPVVMDQQPYQKVENMPSYPGGDDARVAFMVQNIKYPEEAMKKKIQGRVYVTFVVKADGSITNVKILRGIGSGCDEEAMRVVKMMPKWNPGTDKGKPVDVQFNLPISFKLDGKKGEEPKK